MTAREKRKDYAARPASPDTTCFAMLPCEVLYDDNLSAAAMLYYAVLAARATFTGPDAGAVGDVPQRQLAADVRCSQKRAYLYEQQLIEGGHLLKTPSNGRKSRYFLPWIAVHSLKVDDRETAVVDDRGTAVPDDRGRAQTAVVQTAPIQS